MKHIKIDIINIHLQVIFSFIRLSHWYFGWYIFRLWMFYEVRERNYYVLIQEYQTKIVQRISIWTGNIFWFPFSGGIYLIVSEVSKEISSAYNQTDQVVELIKNIFLLPKNNCLFTLYFRVEYKTMISDQIPLFVICFYIYSVVSIISNKIISILKLSWA